MTTKPYNGARRSMKRNRGVAGGASISNPRWASPGSPGTLGGQKLRVFHVDPETGNIPGKPERYVTVGTVGTFHSPTHRIAMAISEALNPVYAPGRCKTLAEMTDEEKARLAEKYGAPVRAERVAA